MFYLNYWELQQVAVGLKGVHWFTFLFWFNQGTHANTQLTQTPIFLSLDWYCCLTISSKKRYSLYPIAASDFFCLFYLFTISWSSFHWLITFFMVFLYLQVKKIDVWFLLNICYREGWFGWTMSFTFWYFFNWYWNLLKKDMKDIWSNLNTSLCSFEAFNGIFNLFKGLYEGDDRA